MIEKLLQIYIANFQAMQKYPWAFLPEFYIYNSCLTLLNYVPLCLTLLSPLAIVDGNSGPFTLRRYTKNKRNTVKIATV